MEALVPPEWLAAHLSEVAVFDATLLAPDSARDAAAEFRAGHIPGAAFLDLASLRDTDSALPNMLPAAEAVAARVGAARAIVLYDDSPWRSAARAWFVLRRAGYAQVALLDGGLAAWRAAGLPLKDGEGRPHEPSVAPAPGVERVVELAGVQQALADGSAQVVDARSPARFDGVEADPHGAAAGHMPGAVNLPYARLFDADGRWLRGEALAAAFRAAGVDPERPVVATCGSGVTAAVLLFGLHLLGQDGALYDGSWTEWGTHPDTAKVSA